MSKMNSFRIINLNYNNNSIRIEDETFRLDGDSTLLSLQNGGGKSVLVQMLIAPFVRKRYRDTSDRLFSSYFTTNKPTYLMVEWKLDGGVGFVLTGMMIRKNQEQSEDDSKEDLDIISFIHEYKDANEYDIHQLPFIEKNQKERKLKGFNASKLMLEGLKKERGRTFQYFDMNQSAQQKQYFDRLKEFQINHSEWETIIKKINLKESGLSELFKDAKDEAGLIDKWFLPTIESKLNKNENRMKEFEKLVFKFIRQYKENQSKIERKEAILSFQNDALLVKEKANEYKNSMELRKEYEEKIAFLSINLTQILEQVTAERKEIQEKLLQLDEQIKEIQYEEASYDLYYITDKMENNKKLQEEYLTEQNQLQGEIIELERKLHILECAGLYLDYKEISKEVLIIENQLEVLKKTEEELLPERKHIGYNLRIRYEDEHSKQKNHLKYLEDILLEKKDELDQCIHKEELDQIKINEINKKIGSYQQFVKSFDDVEQEFNRRYSKSLERNILRVYEEGTLTILKDEYRNEIKLFQSQLLRSKEEKERIDENMISLDREIEDRRSELGTTHAQRQNQDELIKDYQKQLEDRKIILRFLGISEEALFDMPSIEQTFDKKLEELYGIRRTLERQKECLETEYHQLKTGKILELPSEFNDLLSNLDLSYVFGMEWLKKNGNSEEDNRDLINQNPMLPYSLIMSEKELSKLRQSEVDFYTSFPIPIIIREQLVRVQEQVVGTICDFPRISFFVAFNHHLLNEDALKALLKEKEEQIDKIDSLCKQREEEINQYDSRRNILRFQSVNKDNYTKAEETLNGLDSMILELEQALIKLKNKKEELKKRQSILIEEIKSKSQTEEKLKNQYQDFIRLSEQYEEYLQKQNELLQMEKEAAATQERIRKYKEKANDINHFINESHKKLDKGMEHLKWYIDKVNQYQSYKEGNYINKDIEDLEARYEAITKHINQDQIMLEERLKKERNNFNKIQERLIKKAEEYSLEEIDYHEVITDDYLEQDTKRQLKKKLEHQNDIQEKINSIRTDIAVLDSKLKDGIKKLRDEFDKEDLYPRDKILDVEFKKQIKIVRIQKDEVIMLLKQLEEKEMNYNNSLNNLVEFHEFTTNQYFDFEDELILYGGRGIPELNTKELSDFRGRLIRDYRKAKDTQLDKKESLYKVLETLIRKPIYEEEFFKKPLETLIGILEMPNAVLEQLDTVLNSYQALLDKLEIDIAIVDREKQKLIDMLLDYIQEVHKNLGKIDRNSTITVRDRQVKMLKLKLPLWEEQEKLYQTRMQDLVADITIRGLARLQNNENIEEMLGTYITTKNLYHSIIGINAINIKLYKIEAQREYPISWTEVAKNSGGEGFLSAFVVLSSLLSYMRKDDTDIFMEREEGKVLVMDNPFAQTNAAHLLIPLMDIAKKSNTQLICLTGLGGESIYNRFDNIYVMNLITSGLSKDLQYLKSDRIKGEESTQTIIASQVKVEQMEFLF